MSSHIRLGQVITRLGQIRLHQVMLRQVNTDQVKSCQARLGRVMSGHVRTTSSQVRRGLFMTRLNLDRTGQVSSG